MTQTEISDHAKEAANWRVYEKMDGRHCTDLDAIQHGINLAVDSKDAQITELKGLLQSSLDVAQLEAESKDKRIAELEERVSWLEQQREFQIQETKDRENEIEEIRQSKDREIERLKNACDCLQVQRDTAETESVQLHEALESTEDKLTEANAKLAEAEKKLSAVPADWLEDSSLDTWFPMTSKQLAGLKEENFTLMQRLSSAQAEIERLKGCVKNTRDFFNDIVDHGDEPPMLEMKLMREQLDAALAPTK